MDTISAISQDSIVFSSKVEGEDHNRFEILANGIFRYGNGTVSPTEKKPVTVAIPALGNDQYGNPLIYDDNGNVIPRDKNGFVMDLAIPSDPTPLPEEVSFDSLVFEEEEETPSLKFEE